MFTTDTGNNSGSCHICHIFIFVNFLACWAGDNYCSRVIKMYVISFFSHTDSFTCFKRLMGWSNQHRKTVGFFWQTMKERLLIASIIMMKGNCVYFYKIERAVCLEFFLFCSWQVWIYRNIVTAQYRNRATIYSEGPILSA